MLRSIGLPKKSGEMKQRKTKVSQSPQVHRSCNSASQPHAQRATAAVRAAPQQLSMKTAQQAAVQEKPPNADKLHVGIFKGCVQNSHGCVLLRNVALSRLTKFFDVPGSNSIQWVQPKQNGILEYMIWKVNALFRELAIFIQKPFVSTSNCSLIVSGVWRLSQMKDESTDQILKMMYIRRTINETGKFDSVGEDNLLRTLLCRVWQKPADRKDNGASNLCS